MRVKLPLEFLQFLKSLGIVMSVWTEALVYWARVVTMKFLKFLKSLGIVTSVWTETVVYCVRVKSPWSFIVPKIMLRVSRYSHINLD